MELVTTLQAVVNVALMASEVGHASFHLDDGGAAGRRTPVDRLVLLHRHVERSLIVFVKHLR